MVNAFIKCAQSKQKLNLQLLDNKHQILHDIKYKVIDHACILNVQEK